MMKQLFTGPNIEEIYMEKKRVYKDKTIQKMLDVIKEGLKNVGVGDSVSRTSNPFINWFNSMLYSRLQKFTLSQPEQQNPNLTNIDALPDNLYGSGRLLSRQNTFVRMGSKVGSMFNRPSLDLDEFLAAKPDNKSSVSSLKAIEDKSKNTNNVKLTPSLRRTIRKMKRVVKRSKLVDKVFKHLQQDKSLGSEHSLDSDTNDPKPNPSLYPEKVETYNTTVLNKKLLFKENFELNLRKEKHLSALVESIHSIISRPLLNSFNPGMAELIGQDLGDIELIKNLFFSDVSFYKEVLTTFIVRIEYKALNNLDISSIFTSGKLIILILNSM